MSDLNLRPVASSSSGPKPVPSASHLTPWQFEYMPSPDKKDLNLVIMFHGLGMSSSVTRVRLLSPKLLLCDLN